MAVQIEFSPTVIPPISPFSFFVGGGKLFRISLDACRAGQSDEECVEVRTITTLCCTSPVNLTIALTGAALTGVSSPGTNGPL